MPNKEELYKHDLGDPNNCKDSSLEDERDEDDEPEEDDISPQEDYDNEEMNAIIRNTRC